MNLQYHYSCPVLLHCRCFNCRNFLLLLLVVSRENQSSPQPEKKAKTLSEVKSGITQKPVSKTKIIPPQPKRESSYQ